MKPFECIPFLSPFEIVPPFKDIDFTSPTFFRLQQALIKFLGADLIAPMNRLILPMAICILSGSESSSSEPPISAKLLKSKAKNGFKMTKLAIKTVAKKYGIQAGPKKEKRNILKNQ